MTNATARAFQATVAALAGFGLFMVDDSSLLTSAPSVPKAYAVIGRPATPMIYAGVARRTTRRAYAAPAYGAVGAVPAYGTPGECVQVVDEYGRLITQCY